MVAQERAPLTILVVDDGGYGMLRYDQHKAGAEPFGVDLATPDWHQLAGAFGIECEEAEIGAGLADVLRRRLASRAALAGGRAHRAAAPAEHVPAVVPAGVESVPCPTPPTS